MILSMTGYGKAVATYNDKKIHVEIKSLNSKNIDISTRIAPLYRDKEIEIRQLVTNRLTRGKVDLSLWVEKTTASNAAVINTALVENYLDQIRCMANKFDLPEPQDWFSILLKMPDITLKTDIEELEEEEWAVVLQTIHEALDELIAFRRQEGAALEKKFTEKVDNIEKLLGELQTYEPERTRKIKETLVKHLEDVPNLNYDANRLEQELIFYIEKLDISEEKQRLSNHLTYFRTTMQENQPNGKKLGFIAQEMGREINTTGSKSNHAAMQSIVVRMKDELEQIKEQVLNAL